MRGRRPGKLLVLLLTFVLTLSLVQGKAFAAESTAEEQLVALVAVLPEPSEVDSADEAMLEEIYNQIKAIHDFAEENDLILMEEQQNLIDAMMLYHKS